MRGTCQQTHPERKTFTGGVQVCCHRTVHQTYELHITKHTVELSQPQSPFSPFPHIPLYFNTREPFVIIYDCNPLLSNCRESENRGISIDKIPGNALRLTSEDLSYSDRVIAGPLGYIKAPEYQNVMIGDDIGVAGSNVIDQKQTPYIYGRIHTHRRTDSVRMRGYAKAHGYSTTVHNTARIRNTGYSRTIMQVTHYWPCDLGYTGGKPQNFETTSVSNRGEHCIACEVAYYSDDGWLEECDLCPVNKTSYEEAQSECKPVVRRVYEGISWEDTRTIIIILSVGTVGMWLLCVGCQYACYKGRTDRFK